MNTNTPSQPPADHIALLSGAILPVGLALAVVIAVWGTTVHKARPQTENTAQDASSAAGSDDCFGALSWIDEVGGQGSRIEMWRDGLSDDARIRATFDTVSDEWLSAFLIRVTGGRVRSELLGPKGLMGLRRLIAAVAHITALSASSALDGIEQTLVRRFEQSDRRLRSLA